MRTDCITTKSSRNARSERDVDPQMLRGLEAKLRELFPGARIVKARPLADDNSQSATKAHGYGRPMRITIESCGQLHELVFHTLRADDFGHDRRADRLAGAMLSFDTFGRIPRHVKALDIGAIDRDGNLVSLAHSGEPYFITAWAPGHSYADDLHELAKRDSATALDLTRVDALADLLVEIHAAPGSHPEAYARAIRDLLGSGEGIFGLIDSYAVDTPGAPPSRLQRIEHACLDWRWRLKPRVDRLRRTHGDFHPFNILFDDAAAVTLLDASRGAEGDPADDVACLAINFLFFGLRAPHKQGFAQLWTRFWERYQAASSLEVLSAVAPFFAWRGLVLASPRWYPDVTVAQREAIFDFVERALAAERFEPAWGLELLR
ncbi:MAG TPA: phosphotransferase [Kofleriaceae bacterium]